MKFSPTPDNINFGEKGWPGGTSGTAMKRGCNGGRIVGACTVFTLRCDAGCTATSEDAGPCAAEAHSRTGPSVTELSRSA